jgi:hypothetical protein
MYDLPAVGLSTEAKNSPANNEAQEQAHYFTLLHHFNRMIVEYGKKERCCHHLYKPVGHILGSDRGQTMTRKPG